LVYIIIQLVWHVYQLSFNNQFICHLPQTCRFLLCIMQLPLSFFPFFVFLLLILIWCLLFKFVFWRLICDKQAS
jgi:hypothetical protein